MLGKRFRSKLKTDIHDRNSSCWKIMDYDVDEMRVMYNKNISVGENMLLLTNEPSFINVKGVQKLQRKIKKEILFLLETSQSNKMNREHLICTNLNFYKALVEEIINQPDCEAVLETFSYKTSDDCQKRLTVDVVSHKSQQWTKVIARNPTALQQIYREGDSFGRRSIIDQATSYVQAASQNLHLFCLPQIVFSFVNGVPEKMKIFLERLGITVKGEVITLEGDSISSSSEESENEGKATGFTCDIGAVAPIKQKSITRLNLCVTTMIAYVSSLTNGNCNSRFIEPLLNQQAEWEMICPVKPLLDNLFTGKELISCYTAVEDFKNIIDMVGGEQEKCRATALLSNIKVVPDISFPGLKPSGKLKKRSLFIFGTGHAHEAVTVTANKGFVHASKQKGVKFAVVIHESRALTERKQFTEASQK